MRRILPVIVLFAVFASATYAQAYKIDDVGDANEEMWEASADRFAWKLQQKPDSKGYIIIHRGKNTPLGYPIRLAERLKNYFKNNRPLPIERFEILIGEPIEQLNTEIWIVPTGSKSPLDKSVIEEIDTKKTFRFDSFYLPTPEDGQWCCPIGSYTKQEKKVSLNTFAQLLKENPTSNAYLIVYGQYCTRCSEGYILLDSKKTINNILWKEKNYLSKAHKIDASRIKTINGGYYEWQAIELWLVPKGEKPPKAKPTVFPRKRKSKRN